MELDDLKKDWNDISINKNKNTEIMEIIHLKSYGPVAALKREFRKQMLVMLLVPALLLLTNVNDMVHALSSVLFWSYVAFCFGVIAFAYRNYQIARKMEAMDGAVRSNLEQQIEVLETRLRWKIVGLRVVLLFFIVLIEVLPYFQHYRMLDKWHALAPMIRFGAYAALLVTQYFSNRFVMQRKFGTHLDYLKRLVQEMQD